MADRRSPAPFASLRPPDPEPAEGIAENGLPRESVWSYPRPPEIRPEHRAVSVTADGRQIAFSEGAVRVCETAGAPVVYIPADDVETKLLRPTSGKTFCEYKGSASYYDVAAGPHVIERAAWSYPRPSTRYAQLRDHFSFYPALVECRLGDERVRPQPGRFYGGWLTAEITGPLKGQPGSEAW
jgi:uncharacterized protein (DUF427 family)